MIISKTAHPLHYGEQTGERQSKVAVISNMIFHKDSWFTDYTNQVIDNHLEFCRANGFDYFLFDNRVMNYSTLDNTDNRLLLKFKCLPQVYDYSFELPAACGVQKLYSMLYAMHEMGYEHVIQVDVDSLFRAPYELDFDITENTLTYGEVFDFINPFTSPGVLSAYMAARGFKFDEVSDNLRYFNNGGLLHVKRGVFTLEELDDFYTFVSDYASPIGFMKFVTDETFIGFVQMSKGIQPTFFDQKEPDRYNYSTLNKYNVTNISRFNDDGIRHIHFTGDKKPEIKSWLPKSSPNDYGVVPDITRDLVFNILKIVE